MSDVPQEQGTVPEIPTSRMSRAGFFKSIAAQNQNHLFPFLLTANNSVKDSITTSSRYHYTEPLPRLSEDNSHDTAKVTIKVVPTDTLDCAETLTREGKRDIAVLNMANAWTPGGAYLDGAGAQEEALCRRSTLYLTLCREGFYPIPDHGAIYSPDVFVVRKSDVEGCALLTKDERWWTSVISVAAIAHPRLKSSWNLEYARDEDKEDMLERIRTILRVAATEGRKNLVLGALGCGAFMNPPKAVANMFKDVLSDVEFGRRFEGIWFSVIDRKGSDNYKIFKNALDGMQI